MNKLDKYKGTLIGLALGDALGTPFEFWKQEKVKEYFQHNDLEIKKFSRGNISYPAGFYTDDTAQTICLSESLIEKGFNLDDQFDKYKQWYLEGHATPNKECYGIGQQTLRSLSREMINVDSMNGQEEMAGGNGSLMRCAPIGLFYQNNYNEIENKSLLSSYITHNNLIAGWSCVILNTLISLIIDGEDKSELLSLTLKQCNNAPNEITKLLNLDYINLNESNLNISGYSLDTLRIAIWSLINTDDYEGSIKKVILLGNDTDTFGAVTGALSGCYYGYKQIPIKFTESLSNKEYILSLATRLSN